MTLEIDKRGCRYALKRLILFPLLLLGLCSCYLFADTFGYEVFGTTVETLARYPNSQEIWSGHGSCCASDYGTKMYIRWTNDSVDLVQAHYSEYPEAWRADVLAVEMVEFSQLEVCNWIGFYRYDYIGSTNSQSEGCEAVKSETPTWGTLILYSHDYFSG